MLMIRRAKLSAYLGTLSVPEQRAYLRRCGATAVNTSRAPLSFWAVVALARESGGVLEFKDLCPEADAKIKEISAFTGIPEISVMAFLTEFYPLINQKPDNPVGAGDKMTGAEVERNMVNMERLNR